MAEADTAYNATLSAVRGPREITCFRVRVDGQGQILATSAPDFHAAAGRPGFDAEVRVKLRQRYGDEVQITVVADGGAGFDEFRRKVAAGRSPVPPGGSHPSPSPQGGQRGLWDAPGA